MSSLYSIFPKSILPIECGGESGSVNEIAEHWVKKVIDNRQLLIDSTTKYGVDERKRVGVSNNGGNLFGTEGSFRQLEFD